MKAAPSAGTLLLLGVAGAAPTAEELELFRDLQPAGFVLDARNFHTPEQVRRLTDTLRGTSRSHPILAADPADGWGGLDGMPSALPPRGPDEARRLGAAGALTGSLLRCCGCNFLLGPEFDFGPDGWGPASQQVIDRAGQWQRWLRKRGIATCGRHFPAGNGGPPHPADAAALQRDELLPYTALMPELDAVMTGQRLFPAIDPQWPAARSPQVVRKLLRDQLGFDRHLVIAADGGDAAAARQALAAGNDLAVVRHAAATARQAAAALAELPGPLVHEAWERVERLRDRFSHPPAWSAREWEKLTAPPAASGG